MDKYNDATGVTRPSIMSSTAAVAAGILMHVMINN